MLQSCINRIKRDGFLFRPRFLKYYFLNLAVMLFPAFSFCCFIVADSHQQDFSAAAGQSAGVTVFFDLLNGSVGGLILFQLQNHRRSAACLRRGINAISAKPFPAGNSRTTV